MGFRVGFVGFFLFDIVELIYEQFDFELYLDLKCVFEVLLYCYCQDFDIVQKFFVKYSDVFGIYNRFWSEI